MRTRRISGDSRNEPPVLLVGEVRDAQTASIRANDEAVIGSILKRLRADLLTAQRVEALPEHGLVLRGTDAEVRYLATKRTVERVEQRTEDGALRYGWPLTRASLRWSVEEIARGGTVVWTHVAMRDEADETPRERREGFATAVRVGLVPAREAVR